MDYRKLLIFVNPTESDISPKLRGRGSGRKHMFA